MARRRMIDPNIWTSEDVSKLSITERLLLIGMFSNADDFGKGKANPVFLRSTIFPYDDIPVSDICTGLEHISKSINILIYDIDGSKYYKFMNWNKWQRVEHPQDSLIPEPEDMQKNNENNSGVIPEPIKNDSENVHESFQPNINESNISESNIEEDIEENTSSSVDNVDKSNNKQIPYNEIIDYLNLKAGTSYRSTSSKTKTLIKARYNEKFMIDDFKTVIDKKVLEWKGTEFEKFLRPETLFGPKFESYLNQPEGKNGKNSGDTAIDYDGHPYSRQKMQNICDELLGREVKEGGG